MNEQYEQIFGDIWDRFLYWPNYTPLNFGSVEFRAMRISVRAVQLALMKFDGARIRNDARIFLVSSIYSVVVLPQVMRTEQEDEVSEGLERFEQRLLEDVEMDVTQVMRSAQENVREDREVSAAAIVRGLGEVLDDLRLKAAGIWARREG